MNGLNHHRIDLELLFVHIYVFCETTVKRAIEHVIVEPHGQTLEVNDIDGVADNVARMATAESLPSLDIVPFDKSVNQLRRAFEFLSLRETLEDLDELRRARIAKQHFVLDAP